MAVSRFAPAVEIVYKIVQHVDDAARGYFTKGDWSIKSIGQAGLFGILLAKVVSVWLNLCQALTAQVLLVPAHLKTSTERLIVGEGSNVTVRKSSGYCLEIGSSARGRAG